MNHVFLSYRHESDDHAKAVRNLGEKLKSAGLPVELDQFYIEAYPGGPDEGWRKWCEDRAEKSACVLIVCSKGWFDSYRKEGTPGKGLGAALEAAVFSGEIYDEKGRNARVRLVNVDNFKEADIPLRLKDWHIFRLFSGDAEFDQMTKWIRQRLAMPGSLGSPPKVVFLGECIFDMQQERKKLQSFLEGAAHFKI
jgi:TIR domain-containing protein